MINYLPMPHRDELFYSVLCRAYTHSGYLSYKEALRDMLYSKSNNPSIEFIGHLNADFEALVNQVYPIKQLVLNHTMFSQYGRFVPLEQKEKALHHFATDYCDAHHLFCILPRAECDTYLKYCPLCVQEDRNKYGEAYWHRSHQIRNMSICPKHACYLEASSIIAKSEKVFTLSSAEENTPITSPRMTDNSTLTEYCKYMYEVFQAPIELNTDTPISTIFYYALRGSKYMPNSTKARHTQMFAEDLKAYYCKMGLTEIASIYQIQRTLLGDRFDFSVVCQIAYFLGISVNDLTEPSITKEQIAIEQASHYIKDKAPIDWDALDKEIAPKLEQLAYATYWGLNGRPSRVSEKMMYRELNIKAHSLKNLPLCRAILNKYAENYEESWARRLIWAFETLKDERGTALIYWSDLRKISGVKKEKLEKVGPFLFKHTTSAKATEILSIAQGG